MLDLISRQQVIDSLYDWSNHTMTDAETWHLRQVIGDIKSMPSVQPERKTGRWIKEHWMSDKVRECSACHVTQSVTTWRGVANFKYCPYCGAKMEAEE